MVFKVVVYVCISGRDNIGSVLNLSDMDNHVKVDWTGQQCRLSQHYPLCTTTITHCPTNASMCLLHFLLYFLLCNDEFLFDRLVKELNLYNVIQVACGYRHTLALTDGLFSGSS